MESNIIEYHVLFTLDTTQKLKHWKEGLLQWHTFNRRAIVYDDRNYPLDEMVCIRGVNEGDEILMDKALVQIGSLKRTFSKKIHLQQRLKRETNGDGSSSSRPKRQYRAQSTSDKENLNMRTVKKGTVEQTRTSIQKGLKNLPFASNRLQSVLKNDFKTPSKSSSSSS